MNRRGFIKSAAICGTGYLVNGLTGTFGNTFRTTQPDCQGYYTLGIRDGHWWLITPEGRPFFSIGLNHIDAATMRYPENLDLWRNKYNGDIIRWIRESVSPNLKDWGFNTVGWVQEVTVRHWAHSRAFTMQEYAALEMPYCHLLPLMESHQWEQHTRHFDFTGKEWEEWCDYVARAHCAELAQDPNLIGYFYSDCPTWTHDRPQNEWRGPVFDPALLETETGRRELTALSRHYYKTIHDAIRRYDPHHLLLGDRYEANAHIAMPVIEAAMPYVDVLSFQDFNDPVNHLDHWYKTTGKPVLLADAARAGPGEGIFKRNDGKWYSDTLQRLYENPGCIGFHLCGAYQRNKSRARGLLDEFEQPDTENVDLIRSANRKVGGLMAQRFEM